MKLIYVCTLVATLSGCASGPPVDYSFPALPANLMIEPDELKTLKPFAESSKIKPNDETPSNISMSDVLKIVDDNYKTSNKYREQIKALQDWMKQQKELNP